MSRGSSSPLSDHTNAPKINVEDFFLVGHKHNSESIISQIEMVLSEKIAFTFSILVQE